MWMPLFLSYLARARAEIGQFDEASTKISEATTAVETTKERWHEAELNRVAGEIALRAPQPDVAKAETYFARALEVARHQQARSSGTPSRTEHGRASCALKASAGVRATFWLQSMAGSRRASTRSTCGRQSSCSKNWRKTSQSTQRRAYDARRLLERGELRRRRPAGMAFAGRRSSPPRTATLWSNSADLVARALAVLDQDKMRGDGRYREANIASERATRPVVSNRPLPAELTLQQRVLSNGAECSLPIRYFDVQCLVATFLAAPIERPSFCGRGSATGLARGWKSGGRSLLHRVSQDGYRPVQ